VAESCSIHPAGSIYPAVYILAVHMSPHEGLRFGTPDIATASVAPCSCIPQDPSCRQYFPSRGCWVG